MANVLVTGGTGFLGTTLVRVLSDSGHDVTAVSRRPPRTPHPAVRYAQAHVTVLGSVAGLFGDGADTVVHAATSVRRRARVTELRGTREVAETARRHGAHFVYVSIVGVDRNRLPYYRAKLDAEREVERVGGRWTVQRATQFHDLLDVFFGWPVFPRTPDLAFQPVDTGDVSRRLEALVAAGPQGRAEDFGGPDVLSVRTLAKSRAKWRGRAALLVPMPRVGFFADYDRGTHLCPEHRGGARTWEEWLAHRSAGVR